MGFINQLVNPHIDRFSSPVMIINLSPEMIKQHLSGLEWKDSSVHDMGCRDGGFFWRFFVGIFNGNSRILKWRYVSTICLAIFLLGYSLT
jgi:hypothetical protein